MKTPFVRSFLAAAAALAMNLAAAQSAPAVPSTAPAQPPSPFGVAWFFLYGYAGVPAATFMPEIRGLGADFTKVYLFWQQIEPEKGRFDWTAVDAFVNQLRTPEEGLISLFTTSQWATARPSAMLPPSPAKDLEEYYRFVFETVKHCRGRVRYWQNDAEPNNPIYWSGTKEQFVEHLKVFHRAVKAADPSAIVLVGGYDGLFVPPGMKGPDGQPAHPFPQQAAGLEFFEYVLKEAGPAFDVFDLRLYGDPYSINARVDYMRERMRAFGYSRPMMCTEYGGPNLFEFPENHRYIPLVTTWSQALGQPPAGQAGAKPANPIAELYARMPTLAPQTQMFMQGCSPELEAKYQRIQARSVVMRNVFALSAGVERTLYWDLLAAPGDPNDLMNLMYGKIGMLQVENGALGKRTTTAEAYARMTGALAGVLSVRRIELAGQPSIFLFAVDRGAAGLAYVVWDRRDQFAGEDLPAVKCAWPTTLTTARATDALGAEIPVRLEAGEIQLPVSVTPIFLQPTS